MRFSFGTLAAFCLTATVLTSPIMAQNAPTDLAGTVVGSKLRADLGDVLRNTPEGDLVPITIIMTDQVERFLIEQAELLPKAQRRGYVTDLLKDMAVRTQGDLLDYLFDQQAEGNVDADIRPLWIHNLVGVSVTPEVAYEIAARDDVAYLNYNRPIGREVFPVEPQPRFVGDGELLPAEIECGVQIMRAPEVWNDLGITGAGSVVGVIDTGVCLTHPDIQNQIWYNPNEIPNNGVDDDNNGFIDDINGWNFENNNNDVGDNSGHGSHVSGTVAGDGASGTQSGMAPNAEIMMLKFFNSFSGEQSVWDGMQYGVDNGANALTASLGWPHSYNPDRATWRAVCENSIAAGVVVIYASGNEGCSAPPDNVRTPGDVPDILTIGATDCNDNIAYFSSCGPVTWENVDPYNDWPYPPGKIKPSVSAPGLDTKSHARCSGYTTMSGTSMATPHVAGTVALMLEGNPDLSHYEVKEILMETSVDLGDPGMDNTFGAGRVDAFEAVSMAIDLYYNPLDFNYPNGRPDILDPNGGTTMRVEVLAHDQDPQSGSGRLYYDDGSGWVWVAMDEVSPNVYDAVFPVFDCLITVNYFVSAVATNGDTDTDPRRAPEQYYSADVVQGTVPIFNDDFSSDQGWRVAYRDLTDGRWERTMPTGRGGPDADFDGSGWCVVTDNDDYDDVDGGPTWYTSPRFSVDAEGALVSYAHWVNTRGGTADTLDVEISNDDGDTWTLAAQHGGNGEWSAASFWIDEFIAASPTMRLRFTISDNPDDSTTEAAVDAVNITTSFCGRMVLDVTPLTAGQDATLSVSDANAGGTVYFAYSLAGYGSTWVSGLGVALDLSAPKLADSSTADGSGNAAVVVSVPGNAGGVEIFLQAAQSGLKSTVNVQTVN